MTQHTGGSSDGSERNDRAELARLIAAGDWPAAQAALDSLRARYPHRPWHHASAASIAQGQGDLATALHHVDTLLAAQPGHGPMRLRRVQLLFLLDRADEALETIAGRFWSAPVRISSPRTAISTRQTPISPPRSTSRRMPRRPISPSPTLPASTHRPTPRSTGSSAACRSTHRIPAC
jgi:hypothetical protein